MRRLLHQLEDLFSPRTRCGYEPSLTWSASSLVLPICEKNTKKSPLRVQLGSPVLGTSRRIPKSAPKCGRSSGVWRSAVKAACISTERKARETLAGVLEGAVTGTHKRASRKTLTGLSQGVVTGTQRREASQPKSCLIDSRQQKCIPSIQKLWR